MKFGKSKLNSSTSDESKLNIYIETGNLEILGQLYNQYIHLVYGVCLKYFSNREKSQDAVIDIFEKVVKDVKRFDINNFKNWLYVITKNHCLMELRKEKTILRRNDEYLSVNFMENTSEIHPIDIVQNVDEDKNLYECIGKLKDSQRLCIELFYFDSKCYKEIAKQLKISESKVKSGIQNGKRNLKICLEKKLII